MWLWSKLKTLSRLQRITLILFFAVVINSILDSTTGYQILGGDLLGVLFAIGLFLVVLSTIRPLSRRLLWRLRNRLLVTYVLFGVVPVVLMVVMISLSAAILFGQIAANMVQEELDRTVDTAFSSALAIHGLQSTRGALQEIDQELQRTSPPMRAVIRTSAGTSRIPAATELDSIPDWVRPDFKGIIEKDGIFFAAADAGSSNPDHPGDTFVYLPLDNDTLTRLTRQIGSVAVVRVNLNAARVRVNLGRDRKTASDDEISLDPAGTLPPARGFWDLRINWGAPLRATDWSGQRANFVMSVSSRPSLIFARLFKNLGNFGGAISTALLIVAGIFLIVEIVSLIWSMGLTRSITRTVHELYVGTKKVEAGDFTHRIPVRSRNQLSELAGSFNSMTARVQQLLEEVKEKEKLEAELEIAREVQSQLFPKGVPQIDSLELAGICNPARVVSGDYYDFVPVNSRWTALVIGDISGKGISAALLMASVQSSLHAQITALSGLVSEPQSETPSTAMLVARLNRQLYENTSAEKYATFYCAVYDDLNGSLLYTNAGHLPPILIRNGSASRLEVNGMVVGVLPDTPYGQKIVNLEPGDLLVAFTDGITESENAHGEQYGEERLQQLLIDNAEKPLAEIVRLTTDAVRLWASNLEHQDDTTMLLARRL